jgi:hypothetical protein
MGHDITHPRSILLPTLHVITPALNLQYNLKITKETNAERREEP